MAKQVEIGQNVAASIEGSILTVVIDLAKKLGASKSGKSNLVASTGGNTRLPNGAFLGINCYEPITAF